MSEHLVCCAVVAVCVVKPEWVVKAKSFVVSKLKKLVGMD